MRCRIEIGSTFTLGSVRLWMISHYDTEYDMERRGKWGKLKFETNSNLPSYIPYIILLRVRSMLTVLYDNFARGGRLIERNRRVRVVTLSHLNQRH